MEPKPTLDEFRRSRSEAYTERMHAEAARAKAEQAKLELERRQLQRELERPWYLTRPVVQAVVAGIVAIPLIWFFVTEVAGPLQRIENIQLALRNEMTRDSLYEVRGEMEEAIAQFEQERERLLEQLQQHKRDLDTLDSVARELSKAYARLSEEEVTRDPSLETGARYLQRAQTEQAQKQQDVDRQIEGVERLDPSRYLKTPFPSRRADTTAAAQRRHR